MLVSAEDSQVSGTVGILETSKDGASKGGELGSSSQQALSSHHTHRPRWEAVQSSFLLNRQNLAVAMNLAAGYLTFHR